MLGPSHNIGCIWQPLNRTVKLHHNINFPKRDGPSIQIRAFFKFVQVSGSSRWDFRFQISDIMHVSWSSCWDFRFQTTEGRHEMCCVMSWVCCAMTQLCCAMSQLCYAISWVCCKTSILCCVMSWVLYNVLTS